MGLYVSVSVLSIVFTLVLLPYVTGSGAVEAQSSQKGLSTKTESSQRGFENYDIRTAKNDAAVENLMNFRNSSGTTAFAAADARDGMVRAERALRERVPGLKVKYGTELRTPEVISPDVWKANVESLSGATGRSRAETLRSFVKDNNGLLGLTDAETDSLVVSSDYMNPSGNMGFAHLEQKVNGIPVFQGAVKAGFRKDGSLFRVINNLAPGLESSNISDDFGDPSDAVRSAAGYIDYKLQTTDVALNSVASDELKVVFGEGDWATTAEKMYFPIAYGAARPAWRVLIWEPVNAYYVIVDAETGTMLWRKNITEDQSETATYEIYGNPNAFIDSAESPAPLTPGPLNPADATQGAMLARSLRTLVGNETPNWGMNNLGWMTDGTNLTDGNAVEAGIDRDGTNGVDAAQPGDGACPGAGCRVFTSTWNPPPGNPAPGDSPLTAQAQRGAVIQMFYVMNLYHDVLYSLGFNEQAFNFQNDNFGRGGAGNDRVSAEGQDSSGSNNANFSTPADGGRGRMQMYLWTGPNPDYDGTTDVDVIIHEVTHGTSNRLHGNGSGLSSNMSRGMGEGWGDWYGHTLLAEPSDPINGIYTTGGYATYLGAGGTTANFYYGIRRFPKAVIAFTGGPNSRPHNPLTFADLNAGCDLSDGAFPRGPFGSSTCDQVHAAGEVWSSALWEVRALMVSRLGFSAGTRRVLQVVTDGMKLAPIGPTFLEERDAIIAAASAASASPQTSEDVQDVWEGFRRRGMGFSASIQSPSPAQVTEAFDLPNVVVANPGFAVSDSPGDNDSYPEPGEKVLVTVALKNTTGATVTGVTVSINGAPAVNYGDIADGATIDQQIAYTVPAQSTCGGVFDFVIDINSSRGTRQEIRRVLLGAPGDQESENFDGVTAPALPAGWTAAQTGPGVAFVTKTGSADTAPNSAFAPNTGLAGGNSGSTIDSKEYAIATESGQIQFRNWYDTEGGWDGGVLEISINGGAFQDIVSAGGVFLEGGYNGTLGVNQNPLDSRPAWTGDSGGYITTVASLPASANGANVRFRWRFGEDTNTSSVGWNVDSVTVTKNFTCNVASGSRAPYDFDADGKTDVSIFRPNPTVAALGNAAPEGSSSQWWILNSGDLSALGVTFGESGDNPVPRDFTGDGKADIAFFRNSDSSWYVLRSEDMTFYAFPFGAAGDIAAPGDFDGDGKADAAVFRPSIGTWFILRSSDQNVQAVQFGLQGDWPTVADYDGDGKDDIAVHRASDQTWWQFRSTDGVIGYQFGTPDALNAQGDYTGDGKADVAFFAQNTQQWFILRSEDNSFYGFQWGQAADIAAPGDYDGDGKVDAAVFRPSDSTWYIIGSTSGFIAVPFGQTGDQPIPSYGLND